MKAVSYWVLLRALMVLEAQTSYDGAAQQVRDAPLEKAQKYEQEVKRFLDDLSKDFGGPKPQGSFFSSENKDGKNEKVPFPQQAPIGTVHSHMSISSFKKGEACNSTCQAHCVQKLRSFKVTSPSEGPSQILIFVSFSVPEASLKALSKEAQIAGCRLLMRGLYENSFLKTQEKALSLGLVYEIDPPLFEDFKVHSVPTFIHARVEKGQIRAEGHDRLSGNVSLSYALEEFKEKGDVPGASPFLKRLRKEGER